MLRHEASQLPNIHFDHQQAATMKQNFCHAEERSISIAKRSF
jgi:hypothetical protein